MTALLLSLVVAQPASLNLNGQPLTALRCDGGVVCARLGSVAYVYGSGASSSSSGPPIDGGFVLWGGSVGSSNERTLTSSASTTVNTATPGQVKLDVVTPVASASALAADPTDCSAGQYATTIAASGNLTCAQVAFSNLSGSATTGQLPTIPVTKGGTNLTTVAANQVWVGTAADTVAAKTLPSCSNGTTSKLLFNNTTQEFSCGTDQTGGGGGVSPLFVAQGSP